MYENTFETETTGGAVIRAMAGGHQHRGGVVERQWNQLTVPVCLVHRNNGGEKTT